MSSSPMPSASPARPTRPLGAVLLALVAGACARGADGGGVQRVILITCDTLRAHRLGAYGYQGATSPVGHHDACATILDAFGLPLLPTHGRSLLSSALDPERVLPQSLRGQNDPGRWAAISDGRYRAIRSPGGVALYDFVTDPGELHDLIASKGARAERMLARLDHELSTIPPLVERSSRAEGLGPEDLETLESLGYVGD